MNPKQVRNVATGGGGDLVYEPRTQKMLVSWDTFAELWQLRGDKPTAVRLFAARPSQDNADYSTPHDPWLVNAVALSPDEKWAAFGLENGLIQIWKP